MYFLLISDIQHFQYFHLFYLSLFLSPLFLLIQLHRLHFCTTIISECTYMFLAYFRYPAFSTFPSPLSFSISIILTSSPLFSHLKNFRMFFFFFYLFPTFSVYNISISSTFLYFYHINRFHFRTKIISEYVFFFSIISDIQHFQYFYLYLSINHTPNIYFSAIFSYFFHLLLLLLLPFMLFLPLYLYPSVLYLHLYQLFLSVSFCFSLILFLLSPQVSINQLFTITLHFIHTSLSFNLHRSNFHPSPIYFHFCIFFSS